MRLILKIENQDALSNGQPLIQMLERTGLQMGRAPYVDWQLPDPQKLISSEHAEIQFRDGGYVLRDKSRNGTYLNGARVETSDRETRLNDGDRIAIGHYEFSVRLEGDDAQLAPLDGDAAPTGDDVWGASDWAGIGSDPDPVPEVESRTPVHAHDAMTSAFNAPASVGGAPSASAWDAWDAPAAAQPAPYAEPVAAAAPVPASTVSTMALGADAASRAIGAFLKGAGLPADPALLSNPGAIEQAGRTLRVLVAGLYDLLRRQSEMKSVLGIERTMIRMADNNTFKFADSADDAMRRLMTPRESDLPGPASAERSFDDIRKHEERLLSAINDAVSRIVEKLSPQQIKRRETGGVMDMFIPGARKAAWWDELEREHAKLLADNHASLDELIEDELRSAFSRHL